MDRLRQLGTDPVAQEFRNQVGGPHERRVLQSIFGTPTGRDSPLCLDYRTKPAVKAGARLATRRRRLVQRKRGLPIVRGIRQSRQTWCGSPPSQRDRLAADQNGEYIKQRAIRIEPGEMRCQRREKSSSSCFWF